MTLQSQLAVLYSRALHFQMSLVTHMNESCHTHEWVISHIWMSHVTHMNELCLTKECPIAILYSRPLCFQMSHVTHMNVSCHTLDWVMSHTWTSHVTHMNESCHTHERVISHTGIRHVTRMNASCQAYECISHTYTCVMSHTLMWTSHICHTYEPHMNGTCNKLSTCSLICVSARPNQSCMIPYR